MNLKKSVSNEHMQIEILTIDVWKFLTIDDMRCDIQMMTSENIQQGDTLLSIVFYDLNLFFLKTCFVV